MKALSTVLAGCSATFVIYFCFSKEMWPLWSAIAFGVVAAIMDMWTPP